MVWALSPADPLSGEDKYFIFGKGTYKVGRKGCDIIITKDKGVSREHAEIIVQEMVSLYPHQTTSTKASRVKIKDCSKYGTFINKDLKTLKKVHELPNKETVLKDGDLISFGTGTAQYRFSFVPLVFFVYSSESDFRQNLQEKISSIGGHVLCGLSEDLTHVVVDELKPVSDELIDAIVSRKPIVLKSWVELLAEKRICSEIPDCSSYVPTLTLEGQSVKIADSRTRTNCLKGYTCILGSKDKYKFGLRLQHLLEEAGARIIFIEEFSSDSEGPDYGESVPLVCVSPDRSADTIDQMRKLSSVSRIHEIDLLSAVISGALDSSKLILPSVVVSSSCSTDETIVADSEEEVEAATSFQAATRICKEKDLKSALKEDTSMVSPVAISEDSPIMSFMGNPSGITTKIEKVEDPEDGNVDIVYSQDLIVRGLSATITTAEDSNVVNFKGFRKRDVPSGNSFGSLIPFSKYPYKESDGYGDQRMIESIKEEKKRKQMEAIAEDLFNNEKGRRRGVAGSLHGLLTRG